MASEGLGAWMVENGWALAYRRYSLDYVDEEANAQAARRGIWAGQFVRPWEWRRGKRFDTGDYEPCRDCRRPLCLSHATIASSLIWA